MSYKKRTTDESPSREKMSPVWVSAKGSRPNHWCAEMTKANWTRKKWKRAKQPWKKQPGSRDFIR